MKTIVEAAPRATRKARKTPKGNDKLGRCVTLSRSPGRTCPPTCPHNGTDCYAARLAKLRPSVRAAWARNDQVETADWARLEKELVGAAPFRGHVSGDFCRLDCPDLIDRPYLARLLWTLRGARNRGWTGHAWFYTRAWKGGLLERKHKKALERLNVVVYASVFGAHEILDARAAGYLVAFGMPRKAKKDEAFGRPDVLRGAMKCMEQVAKARKHSVIPTCDRCKWCSRGKGDVCFFKH